MVSGEPRISNGKHSSTQLLPVIPPPAQAVLVTVLIALALTGTQSLLLTMHTPTLQLTFDNRETAPLLRGFHAVEQDTSRPSIGAGSYRWTTGDSQITMYQVGYPVGVMSRAHLLLSLHLGPSLPGQAASEFTLDAPRMSTATVATDSRPRHYRILIADDALHAGNLTITLQSDTITVPPDPRSVGLRVEGVTLAFLDAPALRVALPQAALQVVLLGLVALLLYRLRVALLWSGAGVLLVAALLLLAQHNQMLLLYPYLVRLTIAGGILVVLTLWLLPVAERHGGWIATPGLMRALWGIMLLACAIRLTGSLYPLFAPYDISHNVERLIKAIMGTLVVTSRSIEFRNGITVYPPGPYLVLLPGTLVGISPAMLIQGGIAIIDGLGALTIGLLARALGTGRRTALFSALLYAAIPINLTALWWGHTAQIFGQALMLPLAIVLLVMLRQPTPWRSVLLAGSMLSVALLSHIGVTIVTVAWLGLLLLLLRIFRTVPRTVTDVAWWRFAWMLVLGCVLSFLLIYSAVVALKLQQTVEIGEKVLTSDYVPAYGLILRGFQIAFHRLGFVMLLPGLVLLCWRQLPPGGIELIASWLGVVVLFWAIEMVSALQVRYIYFLTPLACIALALLLDKLTTHRGKTRYTVWVIILWLLAQGSTSWYTGTFEDISMSVSPLVR